MDEAGYLEVVRQRPDLPGQEGRLTGSLLGQERVEFIRRSKHEYLETLRQAFQRNDFLSVEFDSLQVTLHPRDTALYGVTLKQHWRSSTYSDTGYLFLLMDFAFPWGRFDGLAGCRAAVRSPLW